MSHSAAATFVGRERELATLSAALDSAASGRGRLVLLVGDAGIGKTALAEQWCTAASDRGAVCLWGRCWEGGGAPAYFPWLEILRAQRRRARQQARTSDEVEEFPELLRLLPETSAVVAEPEVAEPEVASESEQLRFRLFESFAQLFKRISRVQPIVVVLDDLHWADAGSLLLLRFLARELPNLPLLIVATYRSVEVRFDPGLGRLLGDVTADSQRLFIRGLSNAEVRAFVERCGGKPVSAQLVDALHRATEGNPFFVDEVVRYLIAHGEPAAGAALPIPQEVREAVQRRLARLSPPAAELLSLAAAIGQQFDSVVLGLVASRSGNDLRALLEEIERAGTIVRSPGGDGYRFAHTLVRQALYESLSPAIRMTLHRSIAVAIESSGGPQRASEIAHHYLECVLARSDPKERAMDIQRAVEQAQRAGYEALAQLAYEQAASFFERALQALGHLPRATPAISGAAEQQCNISLALGDAQRRAGDLGRARATFRHAARLARSLGDDAGLLARAALGFGAFTAETGAMDDELIRLLEEALEQLGPTDSALRATVLGRLARALYFTPALGRRLELSAAAVDIARRLDDPQATGAALLARHFAIWGPGTAAERLEIADELIDLARQRDDKELELEARVWRVVDLLESGTGHGLELEIDQYIHIAEQARLPRYRWLASVLTAMRALCRDPLDRVEAQLQHALVLGSRSEIINAEPFFFVQLLSLRQAQARAAELRDSVAHQLERFPALKVWRIALVAIEAESGDAMVAQRELLQIGQNNFSGVARDGNWLSAMARLAEACVRIGDRERGALLYDLLSPYADSNIVIATGVALLGSVSHYLALLAQLLGRAAAAAIHFDAALAMHERLGAQSILATTQLRCAQFLRTLPQPPAGRADELQSAARVTAQRLGLTALLAEIDEVGVPQPVIQSSPATFTNASVRPSSDAIFRRDGDVWHLSYGGSAIRLKDTKGLRILHQLLRHPGERIAVMGLAAGAARNGDDELDPATSAEQLRVNVTRSVNAALRRIGADHPELGRHLSSAIRTGQKCAYLPETAVEWSFD